MSELVTAFQDAWAGNCWSFEDEVSSRIVWSLGVKGIPEPLQLRN